MNAERTYSRPTAKEPLVLSYSAVAAFKKCRKAYELEHARRINPNRTSEAAEQGTSFHRYMHGYAETRGFFSELDSQDPMLQVAWKYVEHNGFPQDVLGAEEPQYSKLYGNIWLRTTHDLIYREDDWIVVRDYKGLALSTPIPTPQGWTTMGEIQVGDSVFGSDGKVCSVVAKSEVHYNDCYRLAFDDGSDVVCDHEHRWVVEHGARPKRDILTTEQIAEIVANPKFHVRVVRIQNADPLDLEDVILPMSPYTLGAWLGDGAASNGTICKPDEDLFELIRQDGWEVSPPHKENGGKVPARAIYGLVTALKYAGVWKNKHIPKVYLRASESQRLQLLRGLMDTDGSWNSVRDQAVFTSTDRAMAESVHELVVSLGCRSYLYQGLGHGFGKDVVYWRVTFTPVGFNPFALRRKAQLVPATCSVKATRRCITKVERIPTVPTQCIQVDSPDNTYLFGKNMIPTHNTFDKAPGEQDVELDFQAGIYIAAAMRLYKTELVRFEYEFVRRVPPGTKNSKGAWMPEDCYIRVPVVKPKHEVDRLWVETVDVAKEIVRARRLGGNLFYRSGTRKAFGSPCMGCFVSEFCKRENQFGHLDDEDIELLGGTIEEPLTLPKKEKKK